MAATSENPFVLSGGLEDRGPAQESQSILTGMANNPAPVR